MKAAFSPLFDPFVAAHYADVTAFALQNKLIRKTFPVEDLLEPKFVNEALNKLQWADFWIPVDAKGSPIPAAQKTVSQ
jgi:sulfonate transport system substrate-binding protein